MRVGFFLLDHNISNFLLSCTLNFKHSKFDRKEIVNSIVYLLNCIRLRLSILRWYLCLDMQNWTLGLSWRWSWVSVIAVLKENTITLIKWGMSFPQWFSWQSRTDSHRIWALEYFHKKLLKKVTLQSNCLHQREINNKFLISTDLK